MSTRILSKTTHKSRQKRYQTEPYHISTLIERMQAQTQFWNKSGEVIQTVQIASYATDKIHEHFPQNFVQAAHIVSVNDEEIILACTNHAHAAKLKQFSPSIHRYLNSIGIPGEALNIRVIPSYSSG